MESPAAGRECKHTLNKEYAIDIGDESDKQVIETNIYYEGKLVKKNYRIYLGGCI